MQHILGIILRDNTAEVIDDISPGTESYSFGGLQAAIAEGHKRIEQNSNIKQVNIYKVYDGIKSIGAQGQYQLVYYIPTP